MALSASDMYGWAKRELRWLLGLIASVSAALTPEAVHVPEPWHGRLTIIAVASAAACAYMVQPFQTRGPEAVAITDRRDPQEKP